MLNSPKYTLQLLCRFEQKDAGPASPPPALGTVQYIAGMNLFSRDGVAAVMSLDDHCQYRDDQVPHEMSEHVTYNSILKTCKGVPDLFFLET